MTVTMRYHGEVIGPDSVTAGAAVAEVSLLLDFWQATALEELANRRGLTVGQMVRRLLRDYLLENQRACMDRATGSNS